MTLPLISNLLDSPHRVAMESPVSVRQNGVMDWDNYKLTTLRKPVASAPSMRDSMSAMQNLLQSTIHAEINELRRSYRFQIEPLVMAFLFERPGIRGKLRDAIPQLRAIFGDDQIVTLEVSQEENGYQTLYAVLICHTSVQTASRSLRRFEETWWLDNMTPATADLAFVYDIV